MIQSRIPPKLAHFIEQKFPQAGGFSGVTIRCGERIPFDWLPGDRQRFCGITLWNTIHLRRSNDIDESADCVLLLLHELIHVQQFRARPILFPLIYLWGLMRHGYYNHPAEIEARERAEVLFEEYRRYGG